MIMFSFDTLDFNCNIHFSCNCVNLNTPCKRLMDQNSGQNTVNGNKELYKIDALKILTRKY